MLTEAQKAKAAAFDDIPMDPIQKMAKKLVENHVPDGRSADYYEGFGDAAEKIAGMGLKMEEGIPNVQIQHLLTALPYLAMHAAEKLKALDEAEDKEEERWVLSELKM